MARQVRRWDSYRDDAWIGEVPPPVDLGRPVRFFVKKRYKNDEIVHSYYVSTLSLLSKRLFLADYDDRGAAEVEQFRNDKSGLGLEARRKRDLLHLPGRLVFEQENLVRVELLSQKQFSQDLANCLNRFCSGPDIE